MASYGLPPNLKAAVDAITAGRGASLRQGSAALTASYKAGHASGAAMDLAAYLAVRLPATFAAITFTLLELQRRIPGFMPVSFCDVGSGPGTASWAAAEVWPDLKNFTFVDNNRAFLGLAMDLARHHAALAGAEALLAGLDAAETRADLVVAAYALAEVPEEASGPIARRLWRNTTAALLLLEPGTPAGFARIRRARDALIAEGAAIAAPCPHALACPMAGADWCHFSVRLPRSRLHMQAKAATVPFEDERFSYVIASRLPVSGAERRILAPPRITKAAATIKLCTPAGLEAMSVQRRDAQGYKRARKAGWGDAF